MPPTTDLHVADGKRGLEVLGSNGTDSDFSFPDFKSVPGKEGIPKQAQQSAEHSLSGQLCEKCQDIDFDAIFGMEINDDFRKYGAKVCKLDHINKTNDCRFCSFFRQIIQKDERKVLVAYPANEWFGIHSEQLDDSILLGIQLERLVYGPYQGQCLSLGCIMLSNPSTSALSGRRLFTDAVDYSAIGGWLSVCISHHGEKCSTKNGIPGLRLIDCDSRQILSVKGLVVDYIALSYLWGSDAGENQICNGFLPASIPLVIEDAIKVTKRLGFTYLWVDRYCVSQENKREKHEQIQNMGKIYANAFLTIIASAGEDSNHGLPGVSSTPRTPQPSVSIHSNHLVSTMPNIVTEILNSKWNSRGWTYQEALLSSRRLVFTDSQTYFQCSSMHRLESIVVPLERQHVQSPVSLYSSDNSLRVFPSRGTDEHSGEIVSRIEEYSRRHFSFEADALDGFRGILQIFQTLKCPVDHFLGLPLFSSESFSSSKYSPITKTNKIAQGLMWGSYHHKTVIRRPEFPSWTWVGWQGPLWYNLTQKLGYGKVHSIDIIDDYIYPIQVRVEFEAHQDSQDLLEWEQNFDAISFKVDAGERPRYLHLTSFVLPIDCNRTNDIFKWQIRSEGIHDRYEKKNIRTALKQTLEGVSKDESSFSLCCLVIAINGPTMKERGLWVLIVRPVVGNTHFERIAPGLEEIKYTPFVFDQDRDMLYIGDLELQRQSVKLA